MSGNPLQINDVFWTLQGEGHFSGRRALFIRMPFCNYDCPWCDTEYNSYKEWGEESLIKIINQEPARFAVITGGEPLFHKDLKRVLSILKENKFEIACETNGSTEAPQEIDFITTSPKAYTKGKLDPYYIHPQILSKTNEWKYVVDKQFDFKILERHQPYKDRVYYSLSPEFSDMRNNTEKIMDYIKENPEWQLSLQTHKWISIP